ncbi:MAG: hypothetical protein RL885_27550 [Planctomycetota bacterium]
MSNSLSLLIQLASGRKHAFLQTDAEHNKALLGELDPRQLFQRDLLVVAGSHEEAGFRTSEILRIEVSATELPDWPYGPRVTRAEIVDEVRFDGMRDSLAQLDRSEQSLRLDEEWDGMLELEDTRGDRVHIAFHAEAIAPALRATVLRGLLEADFIHARQANTSVLINPAHIAAARLLPGLPELPPRALVAERDGVD